MIYMIMNNFIVFFGYLLFSFVSVLTTKNTNQPNLKTKKISHKSIILKNCSILGMYLFGGKFCKFMDEELGERECTCPEIIAKHPLCECDRKHFNNFLWATVTVFQVSLVVR